MTVLLGRQAAGTSADFTTGGWTSAWKFVAATSGDLKYIKAQAKVANTATSARMGIYAHDAANNRPVNAAPLGVASVDSLAAFNGTGVAIATLAATVPIVAGTTYWLCWFASSNDSQHNFQGDAGGEYYEAFGDFPAAIPVNWQGPSPVNAIIWGEDAGVETHSGAASTTAGFTSSASGRRKALRAVTTTTGAASAAQGRRISRGAATSTVGVTSTATGTRGGVETHSGAASTTVGVTSTAKGRRVARGAATSIIGAISAAIGRRLSRGAASTTFGATSTATGSNGSVPIRTGSAVTTVGVVSTATGRRISRGACTTTVGSSSSATGRNPAGEPLIYSPRPPGRVSGGSAGRVGGGATGRITGGSTGRVT